MRNKNRVKMHARVKSIVNSSKVFSVMPTEYRQILADVMSRVVRFISREE